MSVTTQTMYIAQIADNFEIGPPPLYQNELVQDALKGTHPQPRLQHRSPRPSTGWLLRVPKAHEGE